jgi:carbon-monoxide dehydrogenase large subunit
MGQGTHTTMAQVVAGTVGVDVQQVVVEQTDTASVSHGTGSFQSRSSVGTATALHRAAAQLREGIVSAAERALGVPAETVEVQGDSVLISGSRLRLADLISELSEEELGALDVEVTYDSPQAAHPLGSHLCMVEVDPETGGVEILRYVVGEDCGNLINPMIVDGQVHGGIAQGMAAVLAEEIVYSDEGQMLTSTFMDYLLPTATECPTVEVKHMETPTPIHDLGFKGIGEGGTIGGTAAVANAVADAIGVSVLRLPLTPARILEQLDRVHRHAERR